MSRLSEAFAKRKTLITFITAGDPSLSVTERLINDLEKSGADIVELGIPFSDPLADGPIIQASHQRALKKGVSLSDVFKLVSKMRKKTRIPVCFMLSYNLILQHGEDKFYADCEKCGVDGVIVPDLPPEEMTVDSRQSTVDRICLIAPTSTEDRIKLAAEKSSGFIYLISVAGITGVREGISGLPAGQAGNIRELLGKIRRYSKLPIAVGFGISTPAQAAEYARIADGVIVGSAIVDLVAKNKLKSIPKLVASLRKAINAS